MISTETISRLVQAALVISVLAVLGGCTSVPPQAAATTSGPRSILAPVTESISELREQFVDLPPPNGTGNRLDHWHDRLYIGMQNLIERTDQKFADDCLRPLPTPAAPFRLGVDSLVVEDGEMALNASVDLDVLLELPNIEKRLRLFITNDDVQESPGEQGRRSNLRAGLRLPAFRALDFDVGLRADFPDAAFMSLRWQRDYSHGDLHVQPFAKLYLQTGDGLGFVSGLTFDRWQDRWLLRSSSYANWRKDRAATEWTQTMLVANISEIIRFARYGPIVRGRDLAGGVGLQLLASGERISTTDTYELSVFAKQPTRKRWLYWRVTPLVRWQRGNNWRAEPGLYVGAEALFWGLATQ